MDSSIKKSRGICVSISREGVRWWTALDPLMVDQFVTISACDWTALFYLAMTMAVMIISSVTERLARLHLVRLVWRQRCAMLVPSPQKEQDT